MKQTIDQFNMYSNQINNICIWFNRNTKLKASYMYDGESIHVELFANDVNICEEAIEKIVEKSEERINLEMNRVIEYLLMLKKEQELNG